MCGVFRGRCTPVCRGEPARPAMKRVNVCGTSGSGKSILSRRLADILGARYVELDAFQHLPRWQVRALDEFRALVSDAILADSWVIDGNYKKVRDLVWPLADTIVFLDYPLPIILSRLTWRTFRRGLFREELWQGNRESIWRHFFVPKDSLYWWVLSTYRRRRAEAHVAMTEQLAAGKNYLLFRHPREADAWLRTIES